LAPFFEEERAVRIVNPSRLSAREKGPYTPEEELEINRGDLSEATVGKAGIDRRLGPTMTLDQVERGLGCHAVHVPEGVSDVVPSASMRFIDREGKPISFEEISANVADFLLAAKAMENTVKRTLRKKEAMNPVEAAIAYTRNANGLRPEQSTAALETDLVKFSVLGFQIGTERDRATMRKLDELCGVLANGLEKNRDLRGQRAVFELGTRRLPEGVPYLVIAGVREAIDYIYGQLEFNEEVIQFLKNEVPATKGWTHEHWNYLRNFKSEVAKLKISGLEDGSIYTGGPILKVEGPPMIAEFIESAVMARISAMTQRATATALIKEVFSGAFAEVGLRRPPSADSLTKDIEACNVVADVPTSSVIAQYLADVRAIGTMEHSAIMLNGGKNETAFFVQWFLMYGEFSAALIDSKTPREGVWAAIAAQRIIDHLRPTLEKDPAYAHIKTWTIPAIRLDSGDLREQVVEFRKMLDDAGMAGTKIMIMDGMHQEKLKRIQFSDDGAVVRVDASAAGESIRFPVAVNDKGEEYHWLSNMIYKATRLYHGDEVIDLMKLSATPAKATRPSRSLHRVYDAEGKMVRDVAGLEGAHGSAQLPEAPPGGRVEQRLSLLAEHGKPRAAFDLRLKDYWRQSRARFDRELASLPMSWQERDAARAASKAWRPTFDESKELVGAVLGFFERAGRREEVERYLRAE
jgi:putative nicotinate phosphoribosyltransferase